jgi:hypothetical protein
MRISPAPAKTAARIGAGSETGPSASAAASLGNGGAVEAAALGEQLSAI